MGVVRLLFALSVLIAHAGLFFNYNVTNANAVLSFYIISGFYMALILDKKYFKNNSRFLFWSNRFLRIFPLYWLTLLLTIIFVLSKFFLHIGTSDNAIVHYIAWSPHQSIFEFYLNLFNYLLRNITLIISFDYIRMNNLTSGYLLVQQAMTLQAELLFYLIAPFIVGLTNKSFIVFFVVYVVGFFGFINHLNLLRSDSLSYYFLYNLIFFLLGIITYRFLYKMLRSGKNTLRLAQSIFIFLILYLISYGVIPLKYRLIIPNGIDLMYFAIFLCSIPFVFLYTKSSVIDNFIGKLSYPVYIMHFLVIKLFSNTKLFSNISNLRTILIIIVTLFVSYFAVKFVDDPIDKFRQKRLKKS